MILTGEKKLVPLNQLKPADPGHYPEVSVKALYSEYAERPEIKPYMPPKVNKGRTLQKEYFFNIVNTFFHDELKAILEHANSLRNSVDEIEQKQESIVMSQKMSEDMFKFPYISVGIYSYVFGTDLDSYRKLKATRSIC